MALAIYRKYRPAAFSDIIGQDLIVSILREAAKQDRLAHAYLFSGPRGTGKTTTARIIAKIANCETRAADKTFRSTGEPCNKCATCRDIDGGRNMDTIEIDAASNRGIDEIRNLKESVRLSPVAARSKVFIIDEAHQLTKEAFNALLKTLEEPPPYIIFILATTESDRVPATILSRTQQFHFKHVMLRDIVSKLKHIAEREKITVSPEALGLIASSAEGSFRDAESLLDQLVAFGDTTIDVHEVEAMIGNIGFDKLSAFAGLLMDSDAAGALETLAGIGDGGYNLVQFTKDLIEYLRRAAVLKYNPQMKELFGRELIENHVKKLEEHASKFTDRHLGLMKALIAAYGQMRYSQFPIIPLEIAIIEQSKPAH